jgi:uncharacterized surface anchored protein
VKLALKESYLISDANGKEVHGVNANGIADILYLPAGAYTVEETTAPTGYAKAVPIKIEVTAVHSMDNPAKVKIADKPLALEISKVRKDNGKGLSGAGFTIAVHGSGKPLTFSVKDGRYLYDPSGKETTVKVDGQGKALAAYLPAGVYDIVETVVPFGFFAAPAQTVTIEDKHTVDAPAAITVENETAVKLGLDSDRLRIPLALGLIFFALVGGTAIFMVVKNKQKK